jgi:hypothetical protein
MRHQAPVLAKVMRQVRQIHREVQRRQELLELTG